MIKIVSPAIIAAPTSPTKNLRAWALEDQKFFQSDASAMDEAVEDTLLDGIETRSRFGGDKMEIRESSLSTNFTFYARNTQT